MRRSFSVNVIFENDFFPVIIKTGVDIKKEKKIFNEPNLQKLIDRFCHLMYTILIKQKIK